MNFTSWSKKKGLLVSSLPLLELGSANKSLQMSLAGFAIRLRLPTETHHVVYHALSQIGGIQKVLSQFPTHTLYYPFRLPSSSSRICEENRNRQLVRYRRIYCELPNIDFLRRIASKGNTSSLFECVPYSGNNVTRGKRPILSGSYENLLIHQKLAFIVPLGAQPNQCYNDITPNDMKSEMTCAWSGALILFGGWAIILWSMLRYKNI